MRHLAEADTVLHGFGTDAPPMRLKTSSKQVLGVAFLMLASLGVAGAPAIAQVNLYGSDDAATNVGLDASQVNVVWGSLE